MTEYRVKVIKQKRVFLSILIVSIGLPFCFLIPTQFELVFLKITVPIITLGIISILIYYFTFGYLKITFENRKFDFEWEQKPIFNFKNKAQLSLMILQK